MTPKDNITLSKDLSIKIFGGYREIGGNLILIQYKDEAIVLDLGLNLSLKNRFYVWPSFDIDEPNELFKLDIARKVPGLYTDWVGPYEPSEPYDTNILAIFISHLHLDHSFMIPQVNRAIPIYMGVASKIIYEAKRDISKKKRYWVDQGIKIKTFRSYNYIKIGDFIVTPIHVDHSIPGAYGFKIETPDGVIAYSGDYRLHGTSTGLGDEDSLTMDFVNYLSNDEIDLFITEGTKFEDVPIFHERDVEEKVKYLIKNSNASALTLFSETDIDRLKTFINVAETLGWRILIPIKHFYIINRLVELDPHIKINLDKSLISVYNRRKTRYDTWERDICELAVNRGYQLITLPQNESFSKTILIGFLSVRRELMKMNIPNGSITILSYSEPMDEEGEIQLDKLLNWLKYMNIPSYRIHCSGHIYLQDLKKLIDIIKPNDVYVVHSEYPDEIKKFLGY